MRSKILTGLTFSKQSRVENTLKMKHHIHYCKDDKWKLLHQDKQNPLPGFAGEKQNISCFSSQQSTPAKDHSKMKEIRYLFLQKGWGKTNAPERGNNYREGRVCRHNLHKQIHNKASMVNTLPNKDEQCMWTKEYNGENKQITKYRKTAEEHKRTIKKRQARINRMVKGQKTGY